MSGGLWMATERPFVVGRVTDECFDVKTIITGRPEQWRRLGVSQTVDHADLYKFTDSIALFIAEVREERNRLTVQVAVLEKECEGLKLALAREREGTEP